MRTKKKGRRQEQNNSGSNNKEDAEMSLQLCCLFEIAGKGNIELTIKGDFTFSRSQTSPDKAKCGVGCQVWLGQVCGRVPFSLPVWESSLFFIVFLCASDIQRYVDRGSFFLLSSLSCFFLLFPWSMHKYSNS